MHFDTQPVTCRTLELVTASLHKLTAGDGYLYLVRQVARHDGTHGPESGLDAYYSEQGESPGWWFGKGLEGLGSAREEFVVGAGSRVSEGQMLALFGEGRHPNADAIEKAVRADARAAGKSPEQAKKLGLAASRLGRKFYQFDGQSDFRAQCAKAFADANREAGLPADWALSGEERALIRTDVASRMFREQHDRAPAPGELDRWVVRASKAPAAVAGYDLTFSPVKTVSALWAIAPRDVAAVIADVHDEAVRDVLGWVEQQVMFTREGRDGIRQVDVRGMIAASFTHRDARSGDPDLHTHVAISNKVQTTSGRWLALDGRVLFKATVAASERYNTRIETLLTQRLGVKFTERAQDDPRKRAVREIVGVPSDLAQVWSSRRVAIEGARDELVARFVAEHGRHPSPVEMVKLAQQATLDTRDAKHEPRSEADQRAVWRTEAEGVLGGPETVDRVLQMVQQAGASRVPTTGTVDEIAASVIARLEQSRARWQVWHVRAEVERQLRGSDVDPARVDALVETITDTALRAVSTPLRPDDSVPVPGELTRADGTSVYEVAGARLYTSPRILSAEQRLVDAASQFGGLALAPETVNMALLESMANGLTLNPAQAQMVRDFACSGRLLQLAIAPAGSGKTTAMKVLSQAWTSQGGRVVGLAPTAVAGKGLGEQIDGMSDTLASLTYALASGRDLPAWTADVDERTLAIVDEAGMASTVDLDLAVTWFHSKGASVRLIGDDQQLAAVSAGGVLRDIAATSGVSTLSELVRFSDQAEASATLALRSGDVTALGFYVDHDRVHFGSAQAVSDSAYSAWAHARLDGVDAVMLAPTREQVRELNVRAQADRRAREPGADENVRLSDGTTAYKDDTVVTRLNRRDLTTTSTDFVKNGDRWTVDAVHADGSLTVRHVHHRHAVVLPADYVTSNTELGYASTVHGAQGITADACHVVVSGAESRQLLYVALTRGRHSNHVYVTSDTTTTDLHDLTRPSLLTPSSDLEVLAAIVGRDDSQVSATTEARLLSHPSRALTRLAGQYRDAVPALIDATAPAGADERLVQVADELLPGLSGAAAWTTLRERTMLAAAHQSQDPADLLADTIRGHLEHEAQQVAEPALPGMTGDLDVDGEDLAAVLARRVAVPTDPRHHWLPTAPASIATDPRWRDYLEELRTRFEASTVEVREHAQGWTSRTAPGWARPLLDAPGDLVADVAVWRAIYAIDDTDDRLVGQNLPGADGKHQRALLRRIHDALPALTSRHDLWTDMARDVAPEIVQDPFWPTLVDRLDSLARAGLPVRELMAAAAGTTPLPLEMPAAALWWRISGHVAPAVLEGGASTLRPEWTTDLTNLLGEGRTARLLDDPAWPSVVAAVHQASGAGWTPAQVLGAALERLGDETLTGDLGHALAGRVTLLAHESVNDPYRHIPLVDVEPDDLPFEDLADAAPPEEWVGDVDEQWVPPNDDTLASSAGWETETPPDLREAESAMPDMPDLVTALAALDIAEGYRLVTDSMYPVSDSAIPSESLTPRQARIAALNEAAATFYTGNLDDSWAGDYLRGRLPAGTDTTVARPGYAPDQWTALVDHLRSTMGATDVELVDAGLARAGRRGVYDAFRDRLVLPVIDREGVVRAFSARRNPDATDDGSRGPKYLNTAETALYRKGEHLYGADQLRPGATPVLVEGALDALAITLTGDGTRVGVAALGTALTATHAQQLRAVAGGLTRVVVGTDHDTAGDGAADRAFHQLAAVDITTKRLALPVGSDPAAFAVEHGGAQLHQLIDEAGPLAHDIITRRRPTTEWIADRIHSTEMAAATIAALPPSQWKPALEHALETIDVAPESLYLITADAAKTHAYTLRTARERTIVDTPAPVRRAPTRPSPSRTPSRVPTRRPEALPESERRPQGPTLG